MAQDNKWHELTVKLWQKALCPVDRVLSQDLWKLKDFDETVRNWLESKAKEIANLPYDQMPLDGFTRVLCLSPVEEPEKMNDGFMLKEPIPRPSDRPNPVKDKVGEWCRHIQMPRGDGKPTFKGGVIIYDDWKCCPICGTKRPEKPSLEDKTE